MSTAKERPILFSAPMVRAILTDQKTQTRRLAPFNTNSHGVPFKYINKAEAKVFGLKFDDVHEMANIHCRYGEPGDRLWVRETYMPDPPNDGTWAYVQYMGCKGSPLSDIPKRYRKPKHCMYRATWGGHELVGWKPSIHMPRWASRILLEITDIRAERLQDISEADAKAEGLCRTGITPECGLYPNYADPTEKTGYVRADDSYKSLWEHLNGAGSWDTNPWVWVIEFKRVEPTP